jgi:poly-gamma-glutamate synthesis protein (capsule biosynthesis protein)
VRKLFVALGLLVLLLATGFCLKPLVCPQPLIAPESQIFTLPLKKPSPVPAKKTTFIAVGDVMLGRKVNTQMIKYNDFKYPFLKTASFLSSADLAFGNLESPIVNGCPATNTGMVFCGQEKALEGLIYAGFDVLSIANNHIYNQGRTGRGQTIDFLAKNGLLASAEELEIKEVNGIRFGFLSFDLTVDNRFGLVLESVKKHTPEVEVLVVSLHWGVEYEKEPRAWQRDLARQAIDSGAKLVVGHHPHVTQPTEEYQGGLIFYSLGNFVFDQMWSEETKKGQIAKVIFEGSEISAYEEIPVYITDYCQPEIVSGPSKPN